VQFERRLGGDTADDPNATKLLEDFAYGRVSAKELVDRVHRRRYVAAAVIAPPAPRLSR
jgi:hypothetical protein